MTYQVLARKYRPQTFDDVIGQETITRTLKNSVARGRIANAYIFCGSRGVGKTTVARLVAKMVNCEKPLPAGPCNKCTSCEEITRGGSIDVLEIDGASNNGVDEVRTLRENVKFLPSRDKYKVYIIDEVHMLSTGAFNALLKTLEEPPAHARFLFATTEPNKVLATIMSRCQKFDFKKIPSAMILDRLLSIAEKEKIVLEKDAALLIARGADGSLRDALVIMDQMMSFSGNKITAGEVIELMGIVPNDRISGLSLAIIEKDPARAIGALDEMITDGKDPVFVANSLIGHYRDLMVFKTVGAPSGGKMFTKEESGQLKQLAEKLSLEEILYALQNLLRSLELMKSTTFTRGALEVTLIRLTRRNSVLSLPEVLAGLGNEKVLPEPEEAENPQPAPEERSFDQGPDAAAFHWKAMLSHIKEKKMSVFTFLNVARPVEFTRDKVVIGLTKDHLFNKEVLETESNRSVIEEAVRKITGASSMVEFITLEFPGEVVAKKEATAAKKDMSKKKIRPVIEKAMDVFGGHIVRDFTTEEQK
ncbi:MAG: DNA polymerase III subunit gamma/tau [Candidatus Omnitrophota bacterium]